VSDLLGRIYQQHRQGLFVLALSITRSRPDAEDAVHEAFTRMCRNGRLGDQDATAYAFAAVRNAAIDRLRGRKPAESVPLSLAACLISPDRAGAERPAEERERDDAIARLVDGLPEDLRIVVVLRVFAGLTFRQIGEFTQSPLQTTVSRFAAALDRLRPDLRKWL
jgi:RNA polymerase sigma-70 factor (ECF subfamily)